MPALMGLLFFSQLSIAVLPTQPTQADHPGSGVYTYQVKHETIQMNGRQVDIYLPAESRTQTQKAPVLVFGHGQAIDVDGYDLSFKHLAQKGIAVIHPSFDSGFFDQDWRRMAADFNQLTELSLKKYAEYLDNKSIVYAGHSKGGYVALMAAGAPNLKQLGIQLRALVLFAPAGFDEEYLKSIDSQIPVTLVWSEADTIIKQSLITTIYTKLPSTFKQWILVKNYPEQKADHFFPLTKSYFFGGKDGADPYHYFGMWKWLIGSCLDVQNNSNLSNTYIYGAEANQTGIPNLTDTITRSW